MYLYIYSVTYKTNLIVTFLSVFKEAYNLATTMSLLDLCFSFSFFSWESCVVCLRVCDRDDVHMGNKIVE